MTQQCTTARRVGRRRGLTLLELMLALTVTAVIGAAISAMLSAVSHGTMSNQDLRALVTRHKTMDARLSAAIRSSHMVLASGSSYLVLWMADTNPDGAPNLSELRRIELDGAGKLWSYKAVFPSGWTQAQITAADTSYPLNSDFNSVTTGLKGNTLFPSEQWMSGVTSITFTLNNASVQSTSLVSYRAVITAGTQSSTAIGAAALRN